MSDPQTVREALIEEDPYCLPYRILPVLGIDPDMPLETLKRRLLWGERVERVADNDGGTSFNDPEDLLAWLTREEA